MTDRKCEICGAPNTLVDSFAYDAEYSYDDYYQTVQPLFEAKHTLN